MAVLWCIIYLAIVIVTGAVVFIAIARGQARSLPEAAGMSIILGLGSLGSILLLLSLMGIPPGRIAIMVIGFMAIGAIGGLLVAGQTPRLQFPRFQSPRIELISLLPILFLLGAVVVNAIIATRFPAFDWDAIVIWGLKAKVLTSSALTPRPWYFTELRYNYSHLDYPLLHPMLLAGGYSMMKSFDEPVVRGILPLFLVGYLFVFYSGARLFIPRLPALLITSIGAAAPYTIFVSAVGSADMPLTAFRTAAVVSMLQWVMLRRRSDAIFCGLFTLFAGLTKAEGLPLAMLLAIVLVAARIREIRNKKVLIDLVIFAGILLIGLGIWLGWRAGLPHTDENYIARLRPSIIATYSYRIHDILINFGWHFTSTEVFGGMWMLLAVMAILGFRAFLTAPTRLLWAMLMLEFALYVLIYIITPWDVNELMFNSINRLIVHMAPLAGLIIASHWGALPWTKTEIPGFEPIMEQNSLGDSVAAPILPDSNA